MKFFENHIWTSGFANPFGLFSIIVQWVVNGATRTSQLLQNSRDLWLVSWNGTRRKDNDVIRSNVNVFHLLIVFRIQKTGESRKWLRLTSCQKDNCTLRNRIFSVWIAHPIRRSNFFLIFLTLPTKKRVLLI